MKKMIFIDSEKNLLFCAGMAGTESTSKSYEQKSLAAAFQPTNCLKRAA